MSIKLLDDKQFGGADLTLMYKINELIHEIEDLKTKIRFLENENQQIMKEKAKLKDCFLAKKPILVTLQPDIYQVKTFLIQTRQFMPTFEAKNG